MSSNPRNKPSDEDDIEMGPRHTAAAGDSSDESDHTDSLCFSDAEDHSWRLSPHPNNPSISSPSSPYNATEASPVLNGLPPPDPSRKSCVSDCSFEETDLENGVVETEINKASPDKSEKICRICHLSLVESSGPETGIILGCSCKEDLAAAHRQCAETWFKIKGNKTCEICGSTAINVIGSGENEFIEQWNESSNTNNNTMNNNSTNSGNETRRFWQGHRFLNFLLACMVFAFVISWLFHFNVPG